MTVTSTASGAVGRPRLSRLAVGAVLAAAVIAGCGGAAATAAPTAVPTIAPAPTEAAPSEAPATPAPTEAPVAEPTEAPSEAPAEPAITTPPAGSLLFGYEDLLLYYQSSGYVCQEPGPSAIAAGYTTTICTLEAEGSPTTMIGFLVAEDGTLGDVFTGVLNPAGGEMPSTFDMILPLAFVLGATLGEEEGGAAGEWLAENLGSEMAQAEFNGNTVYTYTVDDESGVGAYAEVATPAYLAAPAP